MKNLQTARSLIQAWNSGNLEKACSFLSDDVTIEDVTQGIEFIGKKAVQKFWEDYEEAFPDSQDEILELFESGSTVIVKALMTGTHTQKFSYWSDAEPTKKQFSTKMVFVMTFQGGKITRIEEYYDRAKILTDLGLFQT